MRKLLLLKTVQFSKNVHVLLALFKNSISTLVVGVCDL